MNNLAAINTSIKVYIHYRIFFKATTVKQNLGKVLYKTELLFDKTKV